MKKLTLFLITTLFIALCSCNKDFSTRLSTGTLEFSKDTVFLDTIFSNIGSSTYNLKVYNKSNKAITIPSIALENGNNSNYRLNVDGLAGKTFENIDILAKDSLYIFIETTVQTNQPDFLYTDKIIFDTQDKAQSVALVTLVKDAKFIFADQNPVNLKIDSLTLDGQPTTLKGRFLKSDELVFTKAKPTVIYGYAAVPADKTLVIEPGASVFFHANSGLIIDKNATLNANGTLDNKITFEADRLEHRFSDIPGQWGTIWLRAGSKNNSIAHALIKNAVIGVLVDSIGNSTTPTLSLNNTEIYNSANFGVLARQANISAYNTVIGSAGEASLGLTVGGAYEFTHCTIANYWNNSLRNLPAVLVNNFFTYTDAAGNDIAETRLLTKANFKNCIITGNNSFELLFDKLDGSPFNYNVSNSLITFNPSNETVANITEMDFNNTAVYQNNILNQTVDFRNNQTNDFIIGINSAAINKGTATSFNTDILGVSRQNAPDIGAYQHIDFN